VGWAEQGRERWVGWVGLLQVGKWKKAMKREMAGLGFFSVFIYFENWFETFEKQFRARSALFGYLKTFENSCIYYIVWEFRFCEKKHRREVY
jgi:hypothetical protein